MQKTIKTPMYFEPDENQAKQSFKDECDINKIMAKFQKTGLINHYASHAPQYGDIPAIDYHEALNIVATAESMFEELPSEARKKFENDPEKFLEFVQNPANSEELAKLGLAHSIPEAVESTQSNEPIVPKGTTKAKQEKSASEE